MNLDVCVDGKLKSLYIYMYGLCAYLDVSSFSAISLTSHPWYQSVKCTLECDLLKEQMGVLHSIKCLRTQTETIILFFAIVNVKISYVDIS